MRISDCSSDVCSSDLPAIQDSVTITRFKSWVDEPDTKAKRARRLAEDVGEAIVSRRLAKIALTEDSPILTGYFSDASGWKIFDQVTVGAVAKEGAWKEALALVEQEQRRAIEHGFTEAEVDEQLAIRRTAFRTRSEEHTSELQSLMRLS